MKITHLLSILFILSILSSSIASVSTASEKAEEVIDSIKETLHHGKNVVEEKVVIAGDYIKEALSKGKHRIEDTIDSIKDTGEKIKERVIHSYEDTKLKAGETFDDLRGKVEDINLGGAKKIIDSAKDMAGDRLEDLKESVGGIGEKARRVGENIREKAKDRVDSATSAFEEAGAETEDLVRKGKGTYEKIKDKLDDTFEGVRETLSDKYNLAKEAIYDTAEGIKEKVLGVKDTLGDSADRLKEKGYDLRDSVVETKNVATKRMPDITLENVKETVSNTIDSAKDILQDNVGDVYEKGKEKANDLIQGAKRTFEGVSSNLEPLYSQGWEKLEMLFKHGQFSMDDFKEFLGAKFDEFNEVMKPGREREGDVKGKKRLEGKLPDRMREFYDLMWNKIEEVFKSGNIGFEDLKLLFSDKTDDLKQMIAKFTDKNLDKKTTDSIDEEIKRIKGLILSWKDKLCDNCKHKKNLWESIKDIFHDWGLKASDKWSGLKEKVVPGNKEEPARPTGEKSTEL